MARRGPRPPVYDHLTPQQLTGDLDDSEEGVAILMPDDLGNAAIVPASVAKMSPEIRSLARELQLVVRQIIDLQGTMSDLVHTLRARGVSWGAIGFLVGTTPQSARQRFGSGDE